MPLFSEEISKKSPEIQRHLHSAFRDAVKHGEIKALRLLTKFKIAKVRAGQKEVFDYAFPENETMVIRSWILANETLPSKGTTAEQAQEMSDDQLIKLIAEQNRKTTTKKRPRKAPAKPKAKAQDPKTEQEPAAKSAKSEATKTATSSPAKSTKTTKSPPANNTKTTKSEATKATESPSSESTKPAETPTKTSQNTEQKQPDKPLLSDATMNQLREQATKATADQRRAEPPKKSGS